MKTILKQGFALMISLCIVGTSMIFIQHNVSAKEETTDSTNMIRKDNIECEFPEDIVEPGPELPEYLYPPKIEKITNVTNGIKIQWKKVKDADGYRIQRKTGKSKWKNLKISKKNEYTDHTVKNGKDYKYRIYAYAANSVDSIESTGTKSITKKFLHLEVPLINYGKKSRRRCKISWKQNKKADGYNIQTSTSKQFKGSAIKKIKTKRKSSTNIGIYKNKFYYVRVRAYKMDGKNIYYSAWSKMKLIK